MRFSPAAKAWLSKVYLGAPNEDGYATIGDLIGYDEDGELVDERPRRERVPEPRIPTHEKRGRPPSKPLSRFSLLTLRQRIEAETAAILADRPNVNPKRARRFAIGQLDPRPPPDALKQATGESERNLTRWRRESGRNTRRNVEGVLADARSVAGRPHQHNNPSGGGAGRATTS